MSSDKPQLLIIVHPGSACGSAEMNVGIEAAESMRLDMQMLVQGWEGAVAVIDGSLSDELSGRRRAWNDWGLAIEEALERAQDAGLLSVRILGDDEDEYNQERAAVDLVRNHGLQPDQINIVLTGAWIDDEGGGCVHSVREALEEIGFKPTIEDAMNLDIDLDIDCDEDSDLDEDEDMVASTPRKPGP